MKIKVLLGLMVLISSAASGSEVKNKEVVLDVRTPAEYAESHIQGAINVDYLSPTFKEEAAKLNRDAAYLVYCRSGSRSAKAIEKMKGLDFGHLRNLGSLQEASKALKTGCEGKTNQC